MSLFITKIRSSRSFLISRNMQRMLGGDPQGKIRKMMDYAHGGDVADPWYTGDFSATFRDVCAGCEGLLKALGY